MSIKSYYRLHPSSSWNINCLIIWSNMSSTSPIWLQTYSCTFSDSDSYEELLTHVNFYCAVAGSSGCWPTDFNLHIFQATWSSPRDRDSCTDQAVVGYARAFIGVVCVFWKPFNIDRKEHSWACVGTRGLWTTICVGFPSPECAPSYCDRRHRSHRPPGRYPPYKASLTSKTSKSQLTV